MGRSALAAILALTLLVPSAVNAQGADGFMQSGRAALAAGDLDAADRHFLAAHSSGAGTGALFNLGLIAVRRGNCTATVLYFTRVLVESPGDPDRPLLEREIGKCEKRMPSTLGTLKVDTKPSRGQIAIRAGAILGHPAGAHDLWLTAPVEVRLPAGRYTVIARQDRYLALETSEEVSAGQVAARTLALTRAPSELLPVIEPVAPDDTPVEVAPTPVETLPLTVTPPPPSAGPLTPWGWTAVGVGAAAIAGAAALNAVGNGKMQTANDDHVPGTPPYVDVYNEGRGLYNAGVGLYVAGGALVAGGIVMLVLDEPEPPVATVAPMALPDGGGLSATARF